MGATYEQFQSQLTMTRDAVAANPALAAALAGPGAVTTFPSVERSVAGAASVTAAAVAAVAGVCAMLLVL
jgi:hypothetical protein